jgi:ubiquitin-conjugating enzyme E2 M
LLFINSSFFRFRLITDIAEFDGDNVAMIEFFNPVDSTRFQVTITPDSGFWLGATYTFIFEIPDHYPHSPPKVTCQTKIYHPNISLEGNVCLDILKEDYWRPVSDINTVINLLIYLFYEPVPHCPLNYEATELFCKDVTQFKNLVETTLRGGHVEGVMFPRLL